MLLSLDASKNRGAGISHRKKNKDITNLFFRNGKLTSEEMDDSAECKRLLNLDPDIYEFRLVFGASAESKQEIAVQARSLSQIMLEIGCQIDLPEAHIVAACHSWIRTHLTR